MQRQFLSHQLITMSWTRIAWWSVALLLLHANHSRADNLTIDEIPLPALRIDGQPAKAHTQGLEVAGASLYVTARREDVHPKLALLLRTAKSATNWDAWDITPRDSGNTACPSIIPEACNPTASAYGSLLPRANLRVAASFVSFPWQP